MRFWLVFLGICLAATAGCASAEPISALLRSIADGGPVPASDAFTRVVNEESIGALPDDDLRKQVLPLARRLLQDPRPEARKRGLLCFMTVTLPHHPSGFRESTDLLEPYVPDLLRIVADRTSPLRNGALFVLGNTLPNVSPKTLAYMSAHLADSDNSVDDISSMAWTLLKARSDPLTNQVIAFARKRQDPKVTQEVLRWFHVQGRPPTKNAAALAFIDDSLDNPDEWVRRRAVEAVEVLPAANRTAFLAKLNRLATDPKEPPEIRSAAEEALKN